MSGWGDALAALLLLGVGVTGCVPAPDADTQAPEPTRGGTLVVAVLADVDSWNPYTTDDATSAAVVDLLYPVLSGYSACGIPGKNSPTNISERRTASSSNNSDADDSG